MTKNKKIGCPKKSVFCLKMTADNNKKWKMEWTRHVIIKFKITHCEFFGTHLYPEVHQFGGLHDKCKPKEIGWKVQNWSSTLTCEAPISSPQRTSWQDVSDSQDIQLKRWLYLRKFLILAQISKKGADVTCVPELYHLGSRAYKYPRSLACQSVSLITSW